MEEETLYAMNVTIVQFVMKQYKWLVSLIHRWMIVWNLDSKYFREIFYFLKTCFLALFFLYKEHKLLRCKKNIYFAQTYLKGGPCLAGLGCIAEQNRLLYAREFILLRFAYCNVRTTEALGTLVFKQQKKRLSAYVRRVAQCSNM